MAEEDSASHRPQQVDGGGRKRLDATKPIVFQVGNLGKDYWDWVHQPEGGRPRFFSSSLAEACSKTPWWIVPLLWLPIFTRALYIGAYGGGAGPWEVATWLLIGIIAWQGLEYFIHRYLFHARPSGYTGITLHFLFHGCHHKYPTDGLRLVFPPLPASLLVAAVYLVLTLTMRSMDQALMLYGSMGYGYVAYDCIHYLIHHAGRRISNVPILGALQRRHLHHHYKSQGTNFGISSPLYDLLLGSWGKG